MSFLGWFMSRVTNFCLGVVWVVTLSRPTSLVLLRCSKVFLSLSLSLIGTLSVSYSFVLLKTSKSTGSDLRPFVTRFLFIGGCYDSRFGD